MLKSEIFFASLRPCAFALNPHFIITVPFRLRAGLHA